MKRDKRTRALRVSFTEKEWRIIERALETMFPYGEDSVFASERMLLPRQALLAVALAVVKEGKMPLRLAVDLRHITEQELQMAESIENGGNLGWIAGPGGVRFRMPE